MSFVLYVCEKPPDTTFVLLEVVNLSNLSFCNKKSLNKKKNFSVFDILQAPTQIYKYKCAACLCP